MRSIGSDTVGADPVAGAARGCELPGRRSGARAGPSAPVCP